MLAVGHAQLAREADDPVGAHDSGIEALEIDAGRDRVQPLGQVGTAFAHVARDIVGHGDDGGGAQLPALDQAVDHRRGEERPVQGGDPRHLEPARESVGDPSRHGRARLDDAHAGRAQARRKFRGQAETRPHGTVPVGQFEMRGAQAQQVGQHRAAGRGHDRGAARGDDGLRGVERRAREAATGK
jgi:hypothetical protein